MKDEQIQQEVQQLFELMKVSAILSCIGSDPEPDNVGNAWMTKLNLENVIKSEIKLESLYQSDDQFDNQNQESSDPGILLELESAMGSGSPNQTLYVDNITFTYEGDGHDVKEDKDYKAKLNSKTEKNPKCRINQHIGTHLKERELKCPYCDFSTNDGSNLKRHSRSHTKKKPYKCPSSDYATAPHDKLITHERLHTEEKKYKCSQCEYSNYTSERIKTHERINHDKNYKFQCPHCEYSTNINSHIKQHVMIHTGEKPYSCPHCEYSTNHRSHLKRHVARIHN